MTKPPWPVALSVAPPPRMTERQLARMQRVLSGRAFAGLDEANAFLQSAQFQHQLHDAPSAATPFERAQEAAYDAWEMSPPQRYEQARQALAIDERCSDAWLILAEQERTWIPKAERKSSQARRTRRGPNPRPSRRVTH